MKNLRNAAPKHNSLYFPREYGAVRLFSRAVRDYFGKQNRREVARAQFPLCPFSRFLKISLSLSF